LYKQTTTLTNVVKNLKERIVLTDVGFQQLVEVTCQSHYCQNRNRKQISPKCLFSLITQKNHQIAF
jgi:hypothetical protein